MKATLLIDEMPKMCIGCPLNLAKSSIVCRHTWTGDTRPEWCPLKPLPQLKDISDRKITYEELRERIGWNACLEEMENESNIND